MSVTTYEQWLADSWNQLAPSTRCHIVEFGAGSLDAVVSLAADVARNGSECDSTAETLAIVVDGLLTEIRSSRAQLARYEAVVQAARELEASWIDGDGYGRVESVNLKTAVDALQEQP